MRASPLLATLPVLATVLAACGTTTPDRPDALGGPDIVPPDGETGCPPAKAGAACVLALYDAAVAGCDPAAVAKLAHRARRPRASSARCGRTAARCSAPTRRSHVAGAFNDWSATALDDRARCAASDLVVAVGAGRRSGLWHVQARRRRDVVARPAQPGVRVRRLRRQCRRAEQRAQHARLRTRSPRRASTQACSTTLGNCRDVTAYLPPGYDALAHAQRTLSRAVHARRPERVGRSRLLLRPHRLGGQRRARRRDRRGPRRAGDRDRRRQHDRDATTSTACRRRAMATFMQFQVDGAAAARARAGALGRPARRGRRQLARRPRLDAPRAAYPQTYARRRVAVGRVLARPGRRHRAARSAARARQAAARDLPRSRRQRRARTAMAPPTRSRSATCSTRWAGSARTRRRARAGPDALCYFTEPGATHDELAWKARTWRFLRFLAAAD